MTLDDIVKESKTSTLSAQGSFTDAGKMGILVKLHAVENSHNTEVLHMTILHDGIEDNLSVRINILQFLPGNMLQKG